MTSCTVGKLRQSPLASSKRSLIISKSFLEIFMEIRLCKLGGLGKRWDSVYFFHHKLIRGLLKVILGIRNNVKISLLHIHMRLKISSIFILPNTRCLLIHRIRLCILHIIDRLEDPLFTFFTPIKIILLNFMVEVFLLSVEFGSDCDGFTGVLGVLLSGVFLGLEISLSYHIIYFLERLLLNIWQVLLLYLILFMTRWCPTS